MRPRPTRRLLHGYAVVLLKDSIVSIANYSPKSRKKSLFFEKTSCRAEKITKQRKAEPQPAGFRLRFRLRFRRRKVLSAGWRSGYPRCDPRPSQHAGCVSPPAFSSVYGLRASSFPAPCRPSCRHPYRTRIRYRFSFQSLPFGLKTVCPPTARLCVSDDCWRKMPLPVESPPQI